MTDEELGQLMQQSWNEYPNEWKFDTFKFGRLVAAAEREACAKLCDGWTHADGDRCAEANRMYDLLRQRAALPREDLEYVVDAVARLKDERLKACVADLIGWGDEERAEIETFVAIAIELMKRTSVSTLRSCARTVELRHLAKEIDRSST